MTAGILPAALFIPSRLDVGIEPYGFVGVPSLLPNLCCSTKFVFALKRAVLLPFFYAALRIRAERAAEIGVSENEGHFRLRQPCERDGALGVADLDIGKARTAKHAEFRQLEIPCELIRAEARRTLRERFALVEERVERLIVRQDDFFVLIVAVHAVLRLAAGRTKTGDTRAVGRQKDRR